MEYPNLPERKLIDVPAISRASRGTCKHFTNNIHNSGRHLHDTMVGAQTTTTRWSWTHILMHIHHHIHIHIEGERNYLG
jgi:hypothetical protein